MLTFKDNKGQGLVEYALILVLVAVVVIVILALLGPAIGNVFSNIVSAIKKMASQLGGRLLLKPNETDGTRWR